MLASADDPRSKLPATPTASTRDEYVQTLLSLSQRFLPAASSPQPVLVPRADGLVAFREHVMPYAASLLRATAGAQAIRRRGLDWRRSAALDVLGEHDDTLLLLGRERDEVTHTHLLRHFLDTSSPGRSSEVARSCARAFEGLLRRKSPGLASLSLERGRAEAERYLTRGSRVDLALHTSNALVFIEAKIDAEERPGQLDDYDKELRAHAGPEQTRVLVFLTNRNDQISTTRAAYVHLTFRDLLVAWLPIAHDGPECGELRRYLKSVAANLVGVAGPDRFERWPIDIQRSCLDFLEKEDL